MRGMTDVDEPAAVAAERLSQRVRRALRLDAVDPDDARKLEQEAQALGVIVIDGLPGSGGSAPRFLVADEPTCCGVIGFGDDGIDIGKTRRRIDR